jgi:AAA+ ATPase superfamily predicted ATPase
MTTERKKSKRATYLNSIENGDIKEAFEYITKHKGAYIIKENGKPVGVKEAISRYKKTGDEKWLLHILVSHLGYFANTLSKVVTKFGINPEDYIHRLYEGLKYSADKCDENRATISYLAAGAYMICARYAYKEIRKRAKETDMSYFGADDDEEVITGGEQLDLLLAEMGIYEVSLHDEDTRQTYN